MKIAIPTNNGRLSLHFGHCAQFAIVEADAESKQIVKTEFSPPPAHEPGALPQWLSDQGVEVVIAGGMGSRAQQLFARYGIETLVGAAETTPEDLVAAYLDGTLASGDNACDH